MNHNECPACSVSLDAEDNFCRQCGFAISPARLPVVRAPMVPAHWQPRVSPMLKGAAVMAAGTIGQFVFRRMVGTLLDDGRRRPMRIKRRGRDADGLQDEAQIITETVMMRRVRIRRQA